MFNLKKNVLPGILGATVLLLAGFAAAHHGRAAYGSDVVTLEATVTDFRFVNPHVQVYFDVTSEAGELQHWQGELTAPNRLARAGWSKSSLEAGDQIRVSGPQARNGGHSIVITELIMPNGESMPLRESLD